MFAKHARHTYETCDTYATHDPYVGCRTVSHGAPKKRQAAVGQGVVVSGLPLWSKKTQILDKLAAEN